jgi:hypothetical protein
MPLQIPDNGDETWKEYWHDAGIADVNNHEVTVVNTRPAIGDTRGLYTL